MKESAIEAALLEWTRKKNLLNYKFVSPSHRGVPDRLIINPHGVVLFLELKQVGRRPTALQNYEMDRLRGHGMNVDWASHLSSAKGIIERVLL